MKFYDALQLDPIALKNHINNAKSKKQKNHFIKALIVRDILLVAFAIVFILILTTFFGNENSSMAVIIFCTLLSLRFVNFGYKISQSLVSLCIVYFILLVSPVLIQKVPPIVALPINIISIFTIVFLTCDKPEMGNGGLFIFGYIFLNGATVSSKVFLQRTEMTIIGLIICGIILYLKHRDKHNDRTIIHLLKDFDIKKEKYQWQLQITLAISLLFFIGGLLNFNHRFMWIGFACSSLLSAYPIKIHDRLINRAIGAIIGSILFGIVYYITPTSIQFLFGPIAGLCLGVCTTYRAKTIFNCFGALLIASSIYGIHGSIILRIFNNLMGILFGYIFFHIFQIVFVKLIINKNKKV